MSMHVTVTLDDEGPIAVKTASGDDDIARLRLEARRLEEASHPGLVSVVPSDPAGEAAGLDVDPAADVELRTRFAGDPVSHWTGSLASVAGLGAAVATTLADLHDMGLVHGRLDSSHILVGEDGRPRLCGLSHPGSAAPEDDVAALGAVLADVVERTPARRRRPLPWMRADAADRRAFHQVIARALDPLTSRRPNARSLAGSLLTAVPGAHLPAGGSPSTGPRPRYVPPDEQLLDLVFTHELTDDERWAQAFGDDPPELPADGEAEVDPSGDATFPREAPPIERGATAPAARRERHGTWARVAAGSSALAAVAVAAGVFVVGGWGSPGTAAPPTAAPEPMPGDVGCEGVEDLAADVDGDGCPEALVIGAGTISAGSAQWTLGEPGDVIAVGDWECDGSITPALLRPGTGDVFVFPGWAPEAAPVTVEASDRLAGAVGLRAERGDDGCDRLVVELSSGATTVVEASQ